MWKGFGKSREDQIFRQIWKKDWRSEVFFFFIFFFLVVVVGVRFLEVVSYFFFLFFFFSFFFSCCCCCRRRCQIKEDRRSIVYMYRRSIVFGEDYTDLEKISFRYYICIGDRQYLERVLDIQRRSDLDSICVQEIDSIWRGLYRSTEIDLSTIHLYGRSKVFGNDFTNLKKIMFWDRYGKKHGDLKCNIFYFICFQLLLLSLPDFERAIKAYCYFLLYMYRRSIVFGEDCTALKKIIFR